MRRLLFAITGLLVLVSVLLLSAAPAQTQPRATLDARLETLDARATEAMFLQGTLRADAEAARATVEAQADVARSTIQAGRENVALTVTVAAETLRENIEEAEAMIQVRATEVAVTIDAIRSRTQEEIQAAIEAALADIPEEYIAFVRYLYENSDVTNAGDGVFLVTTFVSEAAMNELLDVLAGGAGYDPENVSIDAVPGQLVVTASDERGTAILIYELVIVDGGLQPVLVSLTLNGNEVPDDQIPAELDRASQFAIAGASLSPVISGAEDIAYSFVVTEANISDAGILLSYEITVG